MLELLVPVGNRGERNFYADFFNAPIYAITNCIQQEMDKKCLRRTN
jgi:hypothetical protein